MYFLPSSVMKVEKLQKNRKHQKEENKSFIFFHYRRNISRAYCHGLHQNYWSLSKKDNFSIARKKKKIPVWDKQKYIKLKNTLSYTGFAAVKLKKKYEMYVVFSALIFMPHSNVYWKIATLYSMFATLGS